jgi:predicted MFS family arabinose efflux permease
MLGPAVGLGLGRFSYALVLPAMQAQLGWSFTIAGALNTANATGYLIGAPLAAGATRRVGERRSFLLAMVATTLALLGSAGTGNLFVLVVLRLMAGVSGAVCFVAGAGLAAQAGSSVSRTRATLLLGLYFAGSGVGIVLSGLLVPVALAIGTWKAAWLTLGGLSLLCLAVAVPAVRAVPEAAPSASAGEQDRPQLRSLSALLGAYGLYGAGYIAYMTFIVAALRGAGAGNTEITLFWTVLGTSGVAAAFVCGPLLSALRPRTGIAFVLLMLAVGAAIPVLVYGPLAALVSAALFGTTFFTVVTAVTSAACCILPQHQWTTAIAVLTTAFALGQCIGPTLSGAVADGRTGIRLGLAFGAVLILLAAGLAMLHDRHRPRPTD